jgi:hypothetical protein
MLSDMDIVRFLRSENKRRFLTTYSRLLAQHPHVLAKLRLEISSIVGVGDESKIPDRNALKRMKYLSLVIKEGIYNLRACPCLTGVWVRSANNNT